MEGDLEKTYKLTQREIATSVGVGNAHKHFNLKLDFGPYACAFTANGRHVLGAGNRGNICAFDWKTGKLACDFNVQERTFDATWLHNNMLFAVAQRKHVFIYDHAGIEVHALKSHAQAYALDFLKYHFLLTSVGEGGVLRYQDTSTGQLVAEIKTRLGRCEVMRQNPQNALMHLGHQNGTVTLWTPNQATPAVRMLCHRGPVRALAVDATGRYMATAGFDGQLSVWDNRTYAALHSFYTHRPAASVDWSQRGLLAVGHGPHVTVWKDVQAIGSKPKSPYLGHLFEAGEVVNRVRFAPYDDTLAVGHSHGISSLIVPGAGEANFDAFEANPYETKRQRQESEVKQLLNKLQPEMIALDVDFIGKLNAEAAASKSN